MTLRGNGGKSRLCPLWPRTEAVVAGLVRGREEDEAVFPSRLRKPYPRFGAYRLVKRCAAREPSLDGSRITPHVVRHTSTCHLLQAASAVRPPPPQAAVESPPVGTFACTSVL